MDRASSILYTVYVNQKHRIRAVVFDFDGTLYPARALYGHCVDLFLTHPRLVAAFSSVRKELRTLQLQDGYAPHDRESLHRLEASLLAQRLGIEERRARATMEKVFYNEISKRFNAVRPYRGVREAIGALRDRGFLVAVLSDLPPQEKIAALGLADLFDHILCAEDSGVLKPHPRAFSDMLESLCLTPEETLYVGNNGSYDIAGAAEAGMRTARRGSPCERADFSFFRWKKFEEWITKEKG